MLKKLIDADKQLREKFIEDIIRDSQRIIDFISEHSDASKDGRFYLYNELTEWSLDIGYLNEEEKNIIKNKLKNSYPLLCKLSFNSLSTKKFIETIKEVKIKIKNEEKLEEVKNIICNFDKLFVSASKSEEEDNVYLLEFQSIIDAFGSAIIENKIEHKMVKKIVKDHKKELATLTVKYIEKYFLKGINPSVWFMLDCRWTEDLIKTKLNSKRNKGRIYPAL